MNRWILVLLALIPSDVGARSAPIILKQGRIAEPTSTDTIRITGSPIFSRSTYAASFQILLNGAKPDVWYNSAFAGNNATEGLTTAITVPSSATNVQTNGIASYVRSERAQPGNGGDVAGFFFALSNHSRSAVFPINSVASDSANDAGQILGIEHDYNVNASDTTVNGINLVIVGNTALTGFRNAVIVQGVFHPESRWSNGLVTADGAIDSSGYALFIGAATARGRTDRDSQPIALVSYKSNDTRYIATMRGDHAGGVAIRPGAASGSVAFQEPDGSATWASISSNDFTMSVPVVLKSYTVSTLPTCNPVLEGGMAYVTDAKSPEYNRPLNGGGTTIIPAFCNGTVWTSH